MARFLYLLPVFLLCWSCEKDDLGLTVRKGPKWFTLEVPFNWSFSYDYGIEGGVFGEFSTNREKIFFSVCGDVYFPLSLDEYRRRYDDRMLIYAEDLRIDGNEARIAKVYQEGGPFLEMMVQGPDSCQVNFFRIARPKNEEKIKAIFKSHRFR